MPYCSTAIKIEAPATANEILSSFAKEQYRANAAHPLDERQYNVDNGLNDLRAIQQDDDESIYGFFCRYERDISQVEAKIQDFCKDHAVGCKLVDF